MELIKTNTLLNQGKLSYKRSRCTSTVPKNKYLNISKGKPSFKRVFLIK